VVRPRWEFSKHTAEEVVMYVDRETFHGAFFDKALDAILVEEDEKFLTSNERKQDEVTTNRADNARSRRSLRRRQQRFLARATRL
jgi:Mn-containing catalase